MGSTIKSQLDLFSESFQDETAFRGAIHDLLLRMPGVRNVQVTHGSLEQGKDIVFEATGGLDEVVLSACVIKNSKLVGAVDKAQSTMTVLHQVRQALKNPFLGPDGVSRKVSRVYVITPHEISQAAIVSIIGELETLSGQVVFLGGEELLRRFENHFPEYLLLRSGMLSSYITELRQMYEDDLALSRLHFKHGIISSAKKRTARAYVKPSFFAEIYSMQLFRCAVPGLQNVARGLTTEEFDDLKRYLDKCRDFVDRLGAWDMVPATQLAPVPNLLNRFDHVLDAIKKSWQRQKPARSNTRYRLTKGVDIARILENVQGGFNNLLAPLSKVLELSGSWAKKANISEASVVQSIEYRTYNGLMELSRANPHLLRRESRLTTLTWDSGLLDKYQGPFLITGPPGYGKTSFCKWSALNDGERFAKHDSNVMPIYVPLYRLADSMPSNVEEALMGQDRFPEIWSKPGVLHDGIRIRLYLDGLDELSVSHQSQILSLARDATVKLSQLHVVVTGRDQVVGPNLKWLLRIHIDGLSDLQIRELVSQLLDNDIDLIRTFFDQLERLPSIQQLMRAPLLTTLVVSVFSGMASLPQTKTEIYRIFVDLMCGGWDAAKGVKRRASFSQALKMSVLLRLARRLHESNNREATSYLIREVIHEVVDLDLGRWEELASDIVQDGLLTRDGDSFSFAHLSFQEYLCARDLSDPTMTKSLDGVRRYLEGADWWREVALFSVSMSSRPVQIRELARRYSSKHSERFGSIEQAISEAFPEHRR